MRIEQNASVNVVLFYIIVITATENINKNKSV